MNVLTCSWHTPGGSYCPHGACKHIGRGFVAESTPPHGIGGTACSHLERRQIQFITFKCRVHTTESDDNDRSKIPKPCLYTIIPGNKGINEVLLWLLCISSNTGQKCPKTAHNYSYAITVCLASNTYK
jgi:hypothetical protein